MGIVTVFGVATGILLAPKSGKEVRKDLKENAINAAETIKDTVRKKIEIVENLTVLSAKEVCDVIDTVQRHKGTSDCVKSLAGTI